MTPKLNSSRVDLFLSRAGSIQTPFYREFPPASDLRAFIACTWIRIVRHAGGEIVDAVLPDGCADVMVYDDNPPCIAGPDAVTRHVRLQDGVVITGIRLRPGACRAVLGCPADLLVNSSVRLSDLAPAANSLHRRLLLAGNLSTRITLLEGWVRAALEHASDEDRAVIAACRMLSANSSIQIGEVAEQLDWNVRMIHRRFIAACGYSPKHFQRIMRIQSVLRSARIAPAAPLSDLAIAAGFSDQAHMTRDFRDITGFTPAVYFACTAEPGWGAWINEEW